MSGSEGLVPSGAEALRGHVQKFIRAFGLLADDRTPCGSPISTREAHALMIILERERLEEFPRQSDLVAVLGIDKSNVTRLVQRLQRDGRLQQEPDETDARARILRLTSKGRRLAENIERSSRARFASLLNNIPPEKHDLVLAALNLLNEANQKLSMTREEGTSQR